jgi:hypothetical protein
MSCTARTACDTRHPPRAVIEPRTPITKYSSSSRKYSVSTLNVTDGAIVYIIFSSDVEVNRDIIIIYG